MKNVVDDMVCSGRGVAAHRMLVVMVALFLTVAAFSPSAHAQFNSNVQGTVSDQTGAAVPAATVTLRNVQTGIQYSQRTNSAGYYRFNAVAPGQYQVVVEAQGFGRRIIDTLVTTDQTAGVNVSVAPASTTTTVVVTGQAPVLNPDETRIQATLEAKEITDLPLQNGNAFAVLRTAPGFVGIDEDRNLWAIPIGDTNLNASANGRTSAGNNYQLDGQSISSNNANGNIVLVPMTDQLAEVSVQTTNFAVDGGAGSSARIDFTTKSGTNQFHGNAQMRYSTKGFAATPEFSSSVAPFSRKWYSGSLGGPVWKDHTFMFFSFLKQNQIAPLSSKDTVETPQFLQWAEAAYPNSQDVNIALAMFPPTALTVTDPSFTLAGAKGAPWAPSTSGGPCFSNGTIPIPCDLPFQEVGVFNQSPKVNGWELNARLDHYLQSNGKDRFYGSYFYSKQTSDFLWDRPNYNSNTPGKAAYYNFNYTRIFTPVLTNEASVSYTRTGGGFQKTSGNPLYHLIPFLEIGGPFLFGTPGDSYGKEHNYQFHDNVIWVRASHSFKFGFQALRGDYLNDNASFSARPNTVLFGGWDQFLADSANAYGLGTLSAKDGSFLPQIVGAKRTQFGAYAQDEWKVRPNLLLTFGLRWEDYGNPSDYSNGLPFAQVRLGGPGFSNPQQPEWIGPGKSFGEQISNTFVVRSKNAFAGQQWKNFMPRAAFAWSPRNKHDWSVRGGVGLFEDDISLPGVTSALSSNSFNTLITNEAVWNPAPFNNPSVANLYGTQTKTVPYGITYPTVTPLGFDSRGAIISQINSDGTVQTYSSSLTGADANLKPQKTLLYNIGFEHQIWRDIVFGLTYTGSNSWDQQYSADYNTFVGDELANNGNRNRLTYTPANAVDPASQEFSAINWTKNGLSSNYNALIVSGRQRLRNGLTWNGSYTWGRILGDPIGESFPNPYDPKSFYGRASYDIAHRVSFSLTYDTTVLSAVRGSVLKSALLGWEIGALGVAQSGSPFTVYSSAPFNPGVNDPDFPAYAFGGSQYDNVHKCNNPNFPALTPPPGQTYVVCDPTTSGDYLGNGNTYAPLVVKPGVKTSGFSRQDYKKGIFGSNAGGNLFDSEFANPADYATPGAYVRSNQGRNTFQNPGYFAVDLNVAKKFVLPWRADQKSTLTLAVEATNVFNRVNLGQIQAGAGQGAAGSNDLFATGVNGTNTFGVVGTSNQPRVLQIRARFEF